MKPTTREITTTLQAIEAANRDPEHPRALAREAVRRWRSDAERRGYPVTNTHDDKGAPLLRVDVTLDHAHHERRIGRK